MLKLLKKRRATMNTRKPCTTHRFELKKIQTDFPQTTFRDSESAAEFIRQFYGDDIAIFESFFILMLNNSSKTIGYAKIGQGGTVGVMVDIKLIGKYAVDSLARGVILAHNHPSGKMVPSNEDIQFTSKVKNALALFDIELLDHIILTETDYYSMADMGTIGR